MDEADRNKETSETYDIEGWTVSNVNRESWEATTNTGLEIRL